MIRFAKLLVVPTAFAALVLCVPATQAPAAAQATHPSGSSASQPAKPAAKDPDVVDLEAFKKILADHRGSPLILTIWATWCEPCRDEYPMINDLARQYAPQKVTVIGLSYDDDAEINLVRHFLTRNNPIFVNYRKKMGHVDAFNHGIDPSWPGELPVNFFFAADGRLLYRLDGAQRREVYEQAIRATMAGGGLSHR